MSTGPDDRQHPQDPAEGPPRTDEMLDADAEREPREHAQEPAEGPRD